MSPAPPEDVRAHCLRILECEALATKLEPARPGLPDDRPGPALRIARPARTAGLALSGGAEALPRPGALRAPAARARCLARFAHHELMAVELFAWALLRFPDLPRELRAGFLHVLGEEQTHCRLYLGRLSRLGSSLEEHPASDYFWLHEPALDASPHGPSAFLCAMGLTLEQANLDFTLLYRDAFREAGDEESARVCQRVHDDEVRHVRLAAEWLARLAPAREDDLSAYERAVPFPLGPARAKGRRFDTGARQRAGLSPAFIERVRTARSTQELKPKAPR
jgi:uncharacterized ferritin-like protein (DUF455 family)